MLRWFVWVTLGQAMSFSDMPLARPTRASAAWRLSTALCALVFGALVQPIAAQEAREPASEPDRELVVQAVEKTPHPALASDPTENMDYLALADAPVFLPRSYLYWGSPTGLKGARQPLIFALQLALHLPFYNDLRDKALLGKNWAGAATLSFESDLRMLAERSEPVRMPSYRPNISGQLFYIWYLPHPVLFGLRTGFYHYSNGQEGCTFNAAQGDDTKDCRAITAQVTNPARSLNRISGNFSTNGFLLDVSARLHRLNARGVATSHLSFGFSVAGNFRPGKWGMVPGLARFYGWGRLGTSVEATRVFGRSALTLRTAFSGFPDSGPHVPSVSGELEAVLSPHWLTGFGLFARYYGGRDFYNAFFVDSIQQFAIGLAWDGERPLTFRGSAPSRPAPNQPPQG